MIGFPLAFGRVIDEASLVEPTHGLVDTALKGREPRAHHHVRVQEELPAGSQDAPCFGEHCIHALFIEVLEDIERISFVEARVLERKQANIAARQIHRRERLGREVRAGVDPDELSAARPGEVEKAAVAAADVEDAIVLRRRKHLQHHVHFDPRG